MCKGEFKYYIGTLGGVEGLAKLLALLMLLGGVGDPEAKCLCIKAKSFHHNDELIISTNQK